MKSKSNGIKCRAGKSWWAIVLAALLIPMACSDRNEPDANVAGELQVRLLIDTQISGVTRADAPDAAESVIKELRVYVFNSKGEKVGYYHNGNLGASNTYYVPMKLYESGELDFYVLANESGAGITTLDENTTKASLEAVTFETEKIDTSKGFLMSGHTKQPVTDDTGVTVVECPLARDFSLVNVYFAKTGNFEAKVSSITQSDYTTGDYICYNDYIKTPPAGWNQGYSTETASLLAEEKEIKVIISEEELKTGDYGAAIVARSVSRNIFGSDNCDTPATGASKNPKLTLTYEVGGKEKAANVYLPIIENNTRYNVYCLLKAEGMALWIRVADWNKADNWEGGLDFSYPSYKNPVLPLSGKVEDVKEPSMYYDGADSEKGAFCMLFEITGPENVNWTPVLPGAAGDSYAVKVYLNDMLQTEPYHRTTPGNPYTIKVIPLKSDNMTGDGAKVKFGITYKPEWLGETSKAYFLLINGEAGKPAWPNSGDAPDVIEIKQIEPPTTNN